MSVAFYPTSDWWFWVLDTPPPCGVLEVPEEMRKVKWHRKHPDVSICVDGLVFTSLPSLGGDELGREIIALNALQVLFVSALRTELRVDAGLDWISRLDLLHYDSGSGIAVPRSNHGRNWVVWSRRRPELLAPIDRIARPSRRKLTQGMLETWSGLIDKVFAEDDRALLIAEYGLALSLFHDHSLSSSLVHAFFVAEFLVSRRWVRKFPTKNPRTAIKQKLKDLKGEMDYSLWDCLEAPRGRRNDIAHGIGNVVAISIADAQQAFRGTEGMLQLETGVDLGLSDRGITY